MLSFIRSLCFGAVIVMLTACGSSEDSPAAASVNLSPETGSDEVTATAEDEITPTMIEVTPEVENAVCDADIDGDVDRLDINLIFGARNTPASGSDDPRDADGNGSINVLDARICALRLTNPRCEIEDPDSQSKCAGDCFPNGVAAGDVDQSSVVLWARASFTGNVRFEYGRDPDFLEIDGFVDKCVPDTDIPAKVDITRLIAGTDYYYRACRDSCSPAVAEGSEARGKFRTPYANGKHGLRFGVSSCWRGDMKPFVSMKKVPERNLDFFVALGDTVYADGSEIGGQAKTLTEFHEKYKHAFSQLYPPDDNYPNDNYFALARASTAFYVDIDDHEVVDNFAGAAPPSTHEQSGLCPLACIQDPKGFNCKRCKSVCSTDNKDYVNDGDPETIPSCDRLFINRTDLFKNALQAFHEYHPVREERYSLNRPPRMRGTHKLYRYRTFGKDAAMFILDARSYRDQEQSINAYDDSRTMLGNVQLTKLKADLKDAEKNGIIWKFVLVPEPIQNLDPATASDRFEGYAHERGELLHFIEKNGIANVVFISGDIHGTIANNLTYKRSLLDPQRFSASWDISTGPAAYSGSTIPGPLGQIFTPRVGPLPLEKTGGSEERHDELDRIFAVEFDYMLAQLNNPLIGLGPEYFFGVSPLQQYNRNIPATRLDGPLSYVATHTYGWTEFEINATTQELTVTTYGMDWYEKPSDDAKDYNGDGVKDYSRDEVKILRNRPQWEVSKFKVSANFEEIGSACVRDENCKSKFCKGPGGIAGVCASPKANGKSCTRDNACESGLCDILRCTAPRSKDRFAACSNNRACKSGNCETIGLCGL